MKKKKPQIKANWSRQQKWQLIHGRNYTLNRELAYATAEETGKAPIEYIHHSNREIYLRADPYMGQPVVNGKSLD